MCWFILNFDSFLDCALKNPTPAGYNITGTTEEGDARAVACAAGYDGTPTHSPLTCTDTGDYDSGFAGCTAKGKSCPKKNWIKQL